MGGASHTMPEPTSPRRAGDTGYGQDAVWPGIGVSTVYILPGVSALLGRKVLDLRWRLVATPLALHRVFLRGGGGRHRECRPLQPAARKPR